MEDRQTIEVDGSVDIRVEPNIATLQVTAISTDPKSSKHASTLNAEKARRLIEALKRVGEMRVLHAEPSLHPIYTFEDSDKKQHLLYYEARNEILIETYELDLMSAFVDAAASVETARIDAVRYKLDDKTYMDVERQALENAARAAHKKARSIAKALHVDIVRVLRARQESSSRQPAMYRGVYSEEVAAAPQTPVVRAAVEVSATVELVVEIASRIEELT